VINVSVVASVLKKNYYDAQMKSIAELESRLQDFSPRPCSRSISVTNSPTNAALASAISSLGAGSRAVSQLPFVEMAEQLQHALRALKADCDALRQDAIGMHKTFPQAVSKLQLQMLPAVAAVQEAEQDALRVASREASLLINFV
jgi:hypothetical protein